MQTYGPWELWQALVLYAKAFVYATGVWLPGWWALVGLLALPPLAFLCFRLFPNPFWLYRLAFSPFAGGFAGGYFEAMYERAGSCEKVGGILCVIQAPPQELAMIILAAALAVVFVDLSLPGRKIPRRALGLGDDGGGDDG